MACAYEECGDYQVTPMLVAPCEPMPCCESPAFCYPCLPRCPKGQVVYCCEKKQRPPSDGQDDCCQRPNKRSDNVKEKKSQRQRECSPHHCCPACQHPTCKPVKTKYVIPCYRYEDGRIEQYKPTRHGRLPVSAYRRNGIQDQMHGYRGAIRYLCAGGECNECTVFTAVEPLRKIYPKITQEVQPIKRKKEKKALP